MFIVSMADSYMELNCEPAVVTWWCLDILILVVNYHSQSAVMALMAKDICKVQTLIVIVPFSNIHPAFSGVRVAQSLVFCVIVGRLLVGFVWLNLYFSVSWLVDF